VPSSNEIDEIVKDYLKDETGRPVGLITVPSDFPETPYAIISVSKLDPSGSLDSRESNRDWQYVIRSVGRDNWQVRWMEDRVSSVMMSPQLSAAIGAQWVLQGAVSAIVPDGPNIYSNNSIYRVRM